MTFFKTVNDNKFEIFILVNEYLRFSLESLVIN